MIKARFFLFFLFLSVLVVAVPKSSMAFQVTTDPNAAPLDGCMPEYWGYMLDGGYGYAAEQAIPAKEIINPPSSVHALTCGDQALMSSSKAGAIFSDTGPTSSNPFNPAVSIGLGTFLNGPYGPGTTTTLMSQVASVVDPMLNNLLSNLVGGLTATIGATLTSTFSNLVGGLTSGIPGLSSVISGLMGQNMNCDTMQQTWDNFITGQGLDVGYSFIPQDSLLTRQNLPASLGAAALAQIAANSGIFDKMNQNRQNLSTPGLLFAPVPSLGSNPTLGQVIDAIRSP